MKLLIVDDSLVARKTINAFLKSYNDIEVAGYATNGVEALEKFNELQPDLVTMDITMPEMDGITCLEKMLEINPNTKVLIVTALSDKETGLEAVIKGAKGYLSKPMKPEEFKEAFDKMLEKE